MTLRQLATGVGGVLARAAGQAAGHAPAHANAAGSNAAYTAAATVLLRGGEATSAFRAASALATASAQCQQRQGLAPYLQHAYAGCAAVASARGLPRSWSPAAGGGARGASGDAKPGAQEEAADKKNAKAEADAAAKDGDDGTGAQTGSSEQHPGAEASAETEEASKIIEEAKATEARLQDQVDQLTDRLKRTLAEMENVRMRATREIETAKKFGPQPLIKELLDVPDNLERASAAVPLELPADADKLRSLLLALQDGVHVTERVLLGVFKKYGVEQFNPIGEKFNPDLHNALFEVPDANKDAGMVAVVTKRGYKMHERVVRPADVGVTRAP